MLIRPQSIPMNISELETRAAAGSVVAQSVLGISYLHGIEVAPDYGAALKWLTMAADRGASRAVHNLGLMYEQGLGVPVDPQRAFALHLRAAQHGEWLACIHVARMYSEGRGTSVNKTGALEWYRKAVSEADTVDLSVELAEATDYLRLHANEA